MWCPVTCEAVILFCTLYAVYVNLKSLILTIWWPQLTMVKQLLTSLCRIQPHIEAGSFTAWRLWRFDRQLSWNAFWGLGDIPSAEVIISPVERPILECIGWRRSFFPCSSLLPWLISQSVPCLPSLVMSRAGSFGHLSHQSQSHGVCCITATATICLETYYYHS